MPVHGLELGEDRVLGPAVDHQRGVTAGPDSGSPSALVRGGMRAEHDPKRFGRPAAETEPVGLWHLFTGGFTTHFAHAIPCAFGGATRAVYHALDGDAPLPRGPE